MKEPRGLLSTILGRLLVAALAPLLIVSVASHVISKSAIEQEARADSGRAIEMVALRIEAHLSWQLKMVQQAKLQLLVSRGKIDPNALLDAVVEDVASFESLVLHDRRGTVVAVGLPRERRGERGEFIGLDLSRQPNLANAAGDGTAGRWSDVFPSVIAGHLALSTGDRFDLGTLVATWNLEHLLTRMSEVDAAFPGQLVVVDRRGTVLYHPDPIVMMQRQTWLSGRQLTLARSGVQFVPDFEHEGRRMPVSLRYLAETGWTVIGVHDTQASAAALRQIQVSLLGLVGFATLVAIGLALNLGRRVSRPLEKLARAVQSLALKGPRVELSEQPNRELAALATVFGQMEEAVRLREELLSRLADALSQETGMGALERVSRAASQMFSSDVVLIGSVVDGRIIEPRVVLVDGERIDCESFPLVGSAFELLGTSDSCIEVASLNIRFKDSIWVTRFGVQTLWGRAVRSESLGPHSFLAVGYRGQAVLPIHACELLGLLAARTSAEIYRLQAEAARRLAEAKENETQVALVQAQKLDAVGTLVGGVAHDFNNLLAAMLGFNELAIESCESGDDPRDDLKEVRRTIERARDLVAQLLVFSRPNSEETKRIDLCASVTDAMRLLRSAIPSAIQIETRFERDNLYIGANVTHLQQILVNLCTNAGHAMPNGGTLRISVGRQLSDDDSSAEIVLGVSDTGVGMPPEVVQKAFEPFFTTKPVGKGTGLGLSVVHGLVTAHQGKIGIESKVGEGTKVTLVFPEAADGLVAPSVTEELTVERGRGEQLVVVDDELTLGVWLERTLSRLGYRATVFADPSLAIAYVTGHADAVALVITDLTMPKLNGLELVLRLRQSGVTCPVVLATGNASRVSEEQLAGLSIGCLLHKPYSSAAIGRAVASALAASRQSHAP